MPRLLLVGRDGERLAAVARTHGIAEWTTDLDAALADPAFTIFFDAAATQQRVGVLEKAHRGRQAHLFREAGGAHGRAGARAAQSSRSARAQARRGRGQALSARIAEARRASCERGALGRVVGFRLEFGWWVFDGTDRRAQRPSWNYRAGGGGLILDMYPHWRYVIETIIGRIVRVASAEWIATPERIDEQGARYPVAVEDSATTMVELEGGAFGTILSSWATRVRRDDLLTLQVDGTKGSAVAGLHRCHVQSAAQTPAIAHFSVDEGHRADYRSEWVDAPRARRLSQSLPRRVGAVPAPCRRRRAAGVRFRGRHSRRGVRRGLPSQHDRADLDCVSTAGEGAVNDTRSRTALVTGASTGIGRATALALARAGFDLAVADLDANWLADVAAEAQGRKVVPLALELRSEDSIEQAVTQAADALGAIDLLVNNAGRPLQKPATDVTWAEWNDVIDINLKGSFFLSTAFARHCRSHGRGGAVVSLASTHGLTGIAGRSVYGISKGGIIQMTRMLAIEWAPLGIRVNAVAPTTVLTPSREKLLGEPEARARMLARIPLGRFPTMDEIAAAVCYLASDAAASITGQILVLDGGLTAA